MSKIHYLKHVVQKQKTGVNLGVFSICSANEFVIEAALEYGKSKNFPLLVEATSNQVNQYGGYTGMTAHGFANFVLSLARKVNYPEELLILGGDHLGPNPWQKEPAGTAMNKAKALVKDYATAGFTKIHLDASMYLGGDPGDRKKPLDPAIVAKRTAMLCAAAEQGYARLLELNKGAIAPVYVIGSEVPVPGGIQDTQAELTVTKPEDFHKTVALTKDAFVEAKLEDAWQRVVGVVVQPGVEFGDNSIYEYDSKRAQKLAEALREYPDLIFEGHSTDYQQPKKLKDMVADGVGILKVGPELTFAFREALFLLTHLEEELFNRGEMQLSNLVEVVEQVMLKEPDDWQSYYRGTKVELQFSRKYSFSDRIRYYWLQPSVKEAMDLLLANLSSKEIPLPLLSQYFPVQYRKIRAGKLQNSPRALIKDRIKEVYEKYYYATRP